jgi:hypothetical protein
VEQAIFLIGAMWFLLTTPSSLSQEITYVTYTTYDNTVGFRAFADQVPA